MKNYIANSLQIRGAERYILDGGRGDGMHFVCVRNGKGLEAWISLDRAGDVSRLTFLGDNMGYFAACGYVAPQYFDGVGEGFLKSFTAGFFTTCGLTSVGSPCTDNGEDLPLHGTVSHIPAELMAIEEDSKGLMVKLKITDAISFVRKLVMHRVYFFSYTENSFSVTDTVVNEGTAESPYCIMYHCNMGWPLLTENSEVRIPNAKVTSRNEHAETLAATALQMEKPQAGYEECCYYYDVLEKDGTARAGIYNEDIGKGLVMCYDKAALPCFTEWKMMGEQDYVLGLEPANCTPDGRDVLRKNGTLQFLQPEESRTSKLEFRFVTDKGEFDKLF